jgi:hypothetical protein
MDEGTADFRHGRFGLAGDHASLTDRCAGITPDGMGAQHEAM